MTTLDIDQTLKLAVEHHQAGRWIEAHKLYKQVLAVNPDEPDALRLLGQLTFAAGNYKAAIEMVGRAIELRPGVVDFHIDLGRIYFVQGDFRQAIECFRRATQLDPFAKPQTQFELARSLAAAGENSEALQMVESLIQKNPSADLLALHGSLLLATDRVQLALDRLQQAVQLAPDRADLISTYALALQHRGDFDLAEKQYRRAVQIHPEFAEVRNHLGHLLLLRRQLPAAVVELKEALRLKPQYPQAHHDLALAYTGLGQMEEALASYRVALEQDPQRAETWEALGRVLLDLRHYNAAAVAFNRALAVAETAERFLLLGAAHGGLEDLDSAIAATRRAVELSPLSADVHNGLGGELKWAGLFEPAMAEFRRALQLDPNHRAAHSQLVYSLLMQDGISGEEILEAHGEWGRRHADTVTPLRRPRNNKSAKRKLRVGYISNNFRRQAVSAFVLPILQHHDRDAVEIFCYSDVEIPDEVTRRFMGYAQQWREVWSLNDEQLARQIREDRVDILVELTGHIGKGRLGALAYRPAPVQVSYIGYQGTTGVRAVDYVITDDWADPPGNEKFYVEKPYRMPGAFFVYEPPADAPLVSPLPARRAGKVTFGCLNAVNKVSARAVAIWCEVMSAIPGSQMMLLTTRCEQTNRQLLANFAAGGVSADRVQLVQRTAAEGYFRRYGSIDIALDPIPFNGHTTTCDAAWMGVPTVTLCGDIYAHRFGGSVMRNLGLGDLVTETQAGYLAAAIRLARDLDRLAELRSNLRFTMQKSVITDGPGFVRRLEQAYRQMWEQWRQGQEY
jgi:predicted O-linked N-acetylglucosamine transferase (SPINDLY family)